MLELKNVESLMVQDRSERQPGYITKSVIPALGISMEEYYGWTISLPDSYQIKFTYKNRVCRQRWSSISPSLQLKFFKDIYLPKVVQPCVKHCIAVPEMNKNNQIHLHLICYVDGVLSDYDMACIRKTALCNTMSVHGGSKQKSQYLNYIHRITELPEWINYLEKDLYQHEFPIYVIKSIV